MSVSTPAHGDTDAVTKAYSYNRFNQQISVLTNDVPTAQYTYNAQGIRTSKTVGTEQTNFLLDGGNVVAETQGDALTSYLRGVNLISKTTDTTEYYLFNAHGDVVNLTNSTGTTTKTYDYDAFGNERSPDEADENPFRYCGEYYDTETGTYYLRARYYDPLLGRFTTEDPAMSGLNWYTYCIGNPVTFIDPSGLVEVGLREYAEKTYPGSLVQWCEPYGIAYVHYGDKTLTVKSTSENNRDGRIYVDDSLFVEVFGVGDGLIVYVDSVTRNISIRAAFCVSYYGSTADDLVFQTEDGRWISYFDAFLEGIEYHWSKSIGQYNISTYVGYSSKGISLSIFDTLGRSSVRRHKDGWSKTNWSSVKMYIGQIKPYSLEKYQWVAAHEFAHVLGIGDAYDKAISTESITNGGILEFGVQAADIRMLLRAWTMNCFQEWIESRPQMHIPGSLLR